MELIIYLVIVIIAGIIFLPEYDGGEFRNIPLFIIIVTIALILTLIKILRYVFWVLKIKKMLLKNGYEVTQCHFMPKLKSSKNYHISAVRNEKTVNINLFKRKNSYVTYHFENENKADLYKHIRLTIKPSVRQAYIISPHVDSKKIGEEYFFWSESDFGENIENVLLFKNLPNNVTDTTSQTPLGNGDKICKKILLFDINGFDKYISK
ncbi:MAG: hypothetical protein IJ437_02335 [Clostridia bacterium]|nr:hypothetical protein [Clostridia bacterium]